MINRKIDTTPHRQRHAPERCRQHCFCYQCPRPLFMIFDIVQLSQHTQQAGVQDRCTTVICHASISYVQSLPSCVVLENQCLRFLYHTPQQHTAHRCQLLKKTKIMSLLHELNICFTLVSKSFVRQQQYLITSLNQQLMVLCPAAHCKQVL